jgi:hypothetical protein
LVDHDVKTIGAKSRECELFLTTSLAPRAAQPAATTATDSPSKVERLLAKNSELPKLIVLLSMFFFKLNKNALPDFPGRAL